MQLGQFELAVAVPRDGRAPRIIREYGLNGLTFVEGRPGQPFSLIFRNNSPARVLAVVSIDGLSVLDGNEATALSRGYVVNGYSSVEVKGWRTSLEQTQQFVFETKASSYAAATPNGATNCGVIACKVFSEKPKPIPQVVHVPVVQKVYVPVPYPTYPGPEPIWCYEPTTTASPVPRGTITAQNFTGCTSLTGSVNEVQSNAYGASLSASVNEVPDFTLGTGWGSAQEDRCSEVTFERSLELAALSLYYTDSDSLRKLGINLSKDFAVSTLPQGFSGFCKPPGTAR